MKRRILLLVVALAGGVGLFLALRSRPVDIDTRLSGAYRFPDGHVAGVTPLDGETWRVRDFSNGRVHTLYPDGEERFTARSGWLPEGEADGTVRFTPEALFWSRGGQEVRAGRLRLPEKTGRFPSNGGGEETELYGRLILPEGRGPHPAVVLVHGSEKDSSAVFSPEGWLLAPHGIAVLLFDKRGTGRSDGKFGADLTQLAEDVAAAVDWLRRQPEIDPDRIGLAGYSQGGWISPLAASKSDAVKFVLVGFGMVDSPAEEDRKETLNLLRQKGFGDADLAEADELIRASHQIVGRGLDSDWDRVAELKRRFEDEPWVEALDDGTAGSVMRYPLWALRAFGSMMMPRGLQEHWFYDSRPVLEKLNVPMLWLIAEDDLEAPNEVTLAVLGRLQAQGKPFETVVYPDTDHGIILFEEKDGERVYSGYAPGYFPKKVEWIREQTLTGPRS